LGIDNKPIEGKDVWQQLVNNQPSERTEFLSFQNFWGLIDSNKSGALTNKNRPWASLRNGSWKLLVCQFPSTEDCRPWRLREKPVRWIGLPDGILEGYKYKAEGEKREMLYWLYNVEDDEREEHEHISTTLKKDPSKKVDIERLIDRLAQRMRAIHEGAHYSNGFLCGSKGGSNCKSPQARAKLIQHFGDDGDIEKFPGILEDPCLKCTDEKDSYGNDLLPETTWNLIGHCPTLTQNNGCKKRHLNLDMADGSVKSMTTTQLCCATCKGKDAKGSYFPWWPTSKPGQRNR
jgi:hypothetical protein